MKLENRLYNSRETATLLGISLRTLYSYIKAEQITAINRGGRLFFDNEEIEAFMKRGVTRGYYIGLYGRKDKKEG